MPSRARPVGRVRAPSGLPAAHKETLHIIAPHHRGVGTRSPRGLGFQGLHQIAVPAEGLAQRGAVHREPAPVGLFGAMRALSDPEVQRSIGFAVELARGFGSTTHPTTKALAKTNGVHR